MKAFFLYTELADYTLMCLKTHQSLFPQDELFVVHYPVNPEAPFVFSAIPNVQFICLKDTSANKIISQIAATKPEVILCSGWADKTYNQVVDQIHTTVPVVVCFDNIFRFTFRQIIGIVYARLFMTRKFAAAWVPGLLQLRFARLLGFKTHQIHTGFYSTDNQRFGEMYQKYLPAKSENYPKKILCVARYIPQKGLHLLWQAFSELHAEQFSDWELWCAGTGDDFDKRMQHPAIQHLGFLQPADFEHLVQNCGIFVLPSIFEPWGVVVNEFAAAGFPMLLSDKVGSGTVYLNKGVNGELFQSGNVEDLKSKLRQLMSAPAGTLLQMAAKSHDFGMENSAQKWSETLRKLGNHGN